MSGEAPSTETAAERTDERRNWVEIVRFTLGDRSYGAELGRISQIIRNPTVTAVPQTGPAIAGVANLGGEIVVVIDGRALFEKPSRSDDADTVLLQFDRDTVQSAGLLVDDAPGIEPRHIDHIETPTDIDDWDPQIGEHWFRAVVADPDRTDPPTGVLDVDAIVMEVTERR